MSESSTSASGMSRTASLKRKRESSNEEDLENMPPAKCSSSSFDYGSEAGPSVTLESSSPYTVTSEEDSVSSENCNSEVSKNGTLYADAAYATENLFTPTSVPDSTGSILSPLENVQRDESSTNSNIKLCKPEDILSRRKCPIPRLDWADSKEVWRRMCECDIASANLRCPDLFSRHPGLQLRMRAILLDWLNEVCEVYKLHRETFHLTVNYVDRYLTQISEEVPKGRLQLIGITCLFLAAKVEEVYPPKIGEFAYVTDGACTQGDILEEEVIVLKVLGWSITPITINGWLNLYMQLISDSKTASKWSTSTDKNADKKRGFSFVLTQFSSLEFVICGQLIDLAVLHVGVNSFPYSVLAAGAVAHIFNKELAMQASGYFWEEIEDCYQWLIPFVTVLREAGIISMDRVVPQCDAVGDFMARTGGLNLLCPNINLDESHTIQTHHISLDLFDKVNQYMGDLDHKSDSANVNVTSEVGHENTLTPPKSNQQNSPKTPSTRICKPSNRHVDPPHKIDAASQI